MKHVKTFVAFATFTTGCMTAPETSSQSSASTITAEVANELPVIDEEVEPLLARHCGDAEDEADLKSEIAYEKSEAELAKAHMHRHAIRKAELEADLKLNQASIAKLPTNKKLAYQIAANSIAGMLELSAVKGLVKGRTVTKASTANTCTTATAGEVRLAVASSTGTVWRPPSGGQVGTAAVKLGAGMWLQSGNDTNSERIPIYGAVIAISRAGAEMIAIDDIRQAMVDWNVVLEKAIELEEVARMKWATEVDAREAAVTKLKQQLEELKKRPADDEDGEVAIDELVGIELEETPTEEPFL